MNYSWKKVISGSIAVIFIAGGGIAGGIVAGVQMAVFEVIGLMLLWNADDLGSSTLSGFVTSPTPRWLVNFGGWVVLLFPAFFIWYVSHR
jgi:hypothetical protein